MLDRDLAKAFSLGPLGALLAACVILGACGGSQTEAQMVKPPPQSELAEEDPAQATDDSAMLDIIAAYETEILLDGKPIGKTPLNGYKVAPGRHDVTFVDEKNGNRTMSISVGPNEAQTVKSDAAPPIQENTQPDDDKKR
jgi:hypothetical protein